jgi:hypothetical protein
MSDTPSKRPSKYPPSTPPSSNWVEPTHSIPPSQPRLRAGIAMMCLLLFGSLVVSAIVRACEGGDVTPPPPPQQQSD